MGLWFTMCIYSQVHTQIFYLCFHKHVVVNKLFSICSMKSASGSCPFAYTIFEENGNTSRKLQLTTQVSVFLPILLVPGLEHLIFVQGLLRQLVKFQTERIYLQLKDFFLATWIGKFFSSTLVKKFPLQSSNIPISNLLLFDCLYLIKKIVSSVWTKKLHSSPSLKSACVCSPSFII